MRATKRLFAKEDLTHTVRFITALKITSKRFCHGNFNAPAILFALMHDYPEKGDLTSFQKNAVANISISRETAIKAKDFFYEVYNQDEELADYLNKTISDRFFKPKEVKDRTQDSVTNKIKGILNHPTFNFFED